MKRCPQCHRVETDETLILGKAVELTGFNQHIKGDLGRVYAMSGQRDEALRVLAELTRLAGGRIRFPS